MMRLLKNVGLVVLLTSLVFTSCSDGEDGTDGTNGVNGVNGINGEDGINGADGTNGEDGQNGANGIGYEELAKYGYISVKMEGTRPDGIPFQDSIAYKYTAVEGSSIASLNSVSVSNDFTSFKTRRFISAPEDHVQMAFFDLKLEVQNLGSASQQFGFLQVNLFFHTIIGEDHKFFNLYGQNFVLVENDIIQNFAFDDTTNHLTYDFSVTIPDNQNSGASDLILSGTVDVTVLEQLSSP